MKYFLSVLLVVTVLFFNNKSYSQVEAISKDGQKAMFDKEKMSWSSIELDKSKKVTKYENKDIKIRTSTGQLTLDQLKEKYLNHPDDLEIEAIVTALYGEATCNCVACARSFENCPNGSDCSYRTRIPCNYCCP